MKTFMMPKPLAPPPPRSLLLPSAGVLTLAAGLGFLARGRSLAEGYLIVGPALVLLAGLGAWACWSRAGQSPEEARGWR